MRFVVILFILTFSSTIFSNENDIGDRYYDENLIGAWVGETFDKDGDFKTWTHIKYKNGNYVTSFKYWSEQGGDIVLEDIVYGIWWVENKILCQFEEDWMVNPISYSYKKNTKGCIKYDLLKNVDGSDATDDYSFTSCPRLR